MIDCANVDEARTESGRLFGEHRLARHDRHGTFRCILDHAPFGEVSVNRLCWGARIHLDPGSLPGYYLVSLPSLGAARVRQGRENHELSCGRPGVFSPVHGFILDTGPGYDQLLIRIDATAIARAWHAINGAPLTSPLIFRMAMSADVAMVDAWRALLALAAQTATLPSGTGARRFADAGLADAMATLLLARQAHSHSSLLESPPPVRGTAGPLLRRAEEMLVANLESPPTINEVCVACGVSRRTLFATFHAHRNMGPMAWLRERRLESARAALSASGPQMRRVTDVAQQFGFSHAGDFAAQYRRRFGETPSQTLARNACHAATAKPVWPSNPTP